MKTTEQRFFEKVEKTDTCWNWTAGTFPFGHGLFKFGREQYAHRASWIMHNGPIEGKLCVLHKCDNPKCVNPEHLFLGTRKDNNADRDKKGRQVAPRGEKSSFAKLTRDQALIVRGLRIMGKPRKWVAAKFGISVSGVKAISTGRTWQYI